MNREQIIDLLKNGLKVTFFATAHTGIYKDVFISFGQLPPVVQEVAKEIGPLEFQYLRPDGNFSGNCERDFHKHITYRLRHDYEDKPKEPEPKDDLFDTNEAIFCLEKCLRYFKEKKK
jgi:hypothetical protein